MQYFFQPSFILEVKKLLKNNSYKDCENALIESVFKQNFEEIKVKCSALRLNPSGVNPIAKLRIGFETGKRSEYRLYVFVIIKEDKFYFSHLYPKTGTKGKSALKSKEETEIIRQLLEDVKNDKAIKVFFHPNLNKICYMSNQEIVF